MPHASLPAPLDVAKALSGLLNKDVKVKKAAATQPQLKNKYVGYYDDGGADIEGVWLSDMSLTASLGAALSLIPAGAADEAAKASTMTPDIFDNAREVANILANSFLAKRVRLAHFARFDAQMPPSVGAFIDKPGHSADYQIDIPGYKGGILTLVANKPDPA